MKRLLACGIVAFFGCGGGSDKPLSPDGSGGTTGGYCTYTLTGAVTGTYQCKVLVSGSSNAPSSTEIVINAYDHGAPLAGVVSQWKLHDGLSLSTGTFTQADLPEANMIVTDGLHVWDMTKGADDQENHPDVGTTTLQLTSAGTQIVMGDATVWTHVKGHAEGTAPADPHTGASGEVKITIDFTDSESFPGTEPTLDGGIDLDGGFALDGGGGSNSCVMTFTGGFNAKADCTVSGNNTSGLGQFRINEKNNANASGADAARFHSASAAYSALGMFMIGTFDGSNTVADVGDLQTTDGLHFTGMGGTFTITDTGPSMTFGSTTVFANPHGSYTGVVTTAGQPDVQVSVTF